MCTPPPLSAGGGGVEHPTKFKKGGLTGPQLLKGMTFFREGLQLSHNKLKPEIFNDKKSLEAKIFFFVITKNLNWEILPKNFVNFKR